MKKIFFLCVIMVMALSSCVSLPSPKSYTLIIDYGALTDKGVFVTESNSVSFPYDPIGSISIDELGGWVRKKKETTTRKEVSDDYYFNADNPNGGKTVYRAPDMNAVFDNLAIQLHEMGANGIINLKIIQSLEYQKDVKMFIHKVTISGMAIKR